MAQFWDRTKQGSEEDASKNIFMFNLERKNILVTGANGQLGSEIKRISSQYEDYFHFFFTDVDTLDITNQNDVNRFVKDNGIKYILNCAAYTAVDKAEDDSELCYKINRDAVVNLGVAAVANNAKVIHVSTDYVFDGTKDSAYTESDAVNPQSVYGKSKQEAEVELFKVCPQSIVIRTAWLYSSFGNNFVKTMIKLGKEREALNVVADQTGTPTNGTDLAKAILDIVQFSEINGFAEGIYHYSNEGVTTWYDFTVAIHQEVGITTCKVSPITTDQYPTKAKRPQYSVLDKTKIKNTFNLKIPEWKDSLRRCVDELIN